MNEQIPTPPELAEEKLTKEQFIALAKELSERHEGFPFPGISPESYTEAKASDEQFPGYATPIDILLERFRTQGMKVAFGPHPESGNVYLLPLNSDNINEDGLFPRHLMVLDGMDENVKKLILANKK